MSEETDSGDVSGAGTGQPDGGRLAPNRRRRALLVAGVAIALASVITATAVLAAGSTGSRAIAESVRYHTLPAPCGVLSDATLARYLPDPIVSDAFQRSRRYASYGSCNWNSDSDRQSKSLLLMLTVYRPPHGVIRAWRDSSSVVRVPGLGDQASLQFMTHPPGTSRIKPYADARLTVRSGNAYIDLTYLSFPIGSAPPPPSAAAQIALMTTFARDVLAALAHPVMAVAPRTAPVVQYAVPAHPCALVAKATLAKYFSGAVLSTGQWASLPVPKGVPVSCYWNAYDGTSLSVDVTIDGIADMTGQSGYEYDVQADGQGGTVAKTVTTVNRVQSASGTGAEATVIFKTETVPSLGWFATTHEAELLTWSGDAEIEVMVGYDATTADETPAPPPPSRSAQIAALLAAARDVLAGLTTS
jgi:hypothetical protein